MRPEAKKYLSDISEAADLLAGFLAGKSEEGYKTDPLLRSAVERQFEIVGEALSRLVRLDESAASRISQHRRIISFRNILVHGYAQVDDHLVWDIAMTHLPMLREEVAALLREG
ncbi:MAG: DUF86 domain-containing protein [Candidatus Coatesbacteria bacterium]